MGLVDTSDNLLTEEYSAMQQAVLSAVGILRVGNSKDPSTWVPLSDAIRKLGTYSGEWAPVAKDLGALLKSWQQRPDIPTNIYLYVK